MKNNEAPLEPAAMTALLRNNVFKLNPADLGLTREKCPVVWGVMMELGYPDIVISLVTLADGSCSAYLSDGSGLVGCGLYSEVRQAAANMISIAQRMVSSCQSTFVYPAPADAQVRFYLLTNNGVMTTEASRHALDEGALEIAELYYAGHSVIGMIELLGAGVDIIDEMRMAQAELKNPGTTTDSSGSHAMSGNRSRGRSCRLLPVAGSAARRWHN